MDIWSFVNPFLRVLLYFASFGAVGTILFVLHFGKYQSFRGVRYCRSLVKTSAIMGVLVSIVGFLSLAGNMGGDIVSVFDPIMLQLALESKASLALLTALPGFVILVITGKGESRLTAVTSVFGVVLILLSFLLIGHATKDDLVTQSLLLIHLVGIAFWLGSLLPFRWMCLAGDNENLHFIAHRFGMLAMGYIGVLVIAGLAFAYKLLGSFSALIDTSYGNVLAVKLIAVLFILLLGALNKFRVVPLLIDNQDVGVKRLQSFVNFELALALLILIFSSILSTSLTLPIRM